MIFLHIVFIVGSYYPNYSAVGKCAGNVAEELSKYHKITVICSKNHLNQKNEEVFNCQRIIRIMTKEKKTRFELEDNIQYKIGFKRRINEFRYKIYKVSRMLKTIISKTSIKKDLVQSYVEALNNINEPVDAVIPVSMPFESVVAAVQYKTTYNEKVKVIPYLFDQFVDNENLHRIKFNKDLKRKGHIELENKLFQESQAILAMHSLSAHFKSDLPKISNIYFLEHPLLIKQKSSSVKTCNKNIEISYIGSLLKGYVTPDYLLELYKKSNMEKTALNFYIIGNCSEAVNYYSRQFPNNIINHGSVDKETANKKISNSDILISIAEKQGIQMSSKIFDYISHGKPIIHFYTVEDDVNLKILKKYPNVLCLKQDEELLNENVRAFDDFCDNNYYRIIPYEEVAEIINDATPEYTVEIIRKIIE